MRDSFFFSSWNVNSLAKSSNINKNVRSFEHTLVRKLSLLMLLLSLLYCIIVVAITIPLVVVVMALVVVSLFIQAHNHSDHLHPDPQ